MPKDNFISFRADEEFKARLAALAEKERRTVSQMARILLEDAINERECAAVIRVADEIDMRFCSPHCRHLENELCHCAEVIMSAYPDLNGAALQTAVMGVGFDRRRSDHCPYGEADFRRWQQYADEDAAAIAEYKKRIASTSDDEADW